MNPTLLIVDDEKNTRDGLRLSLEDDYEVYLAADAAETFSVLDNDHVDLVLSDLRLGADNGMDLVERILKRPGPPICMIMTAYGSVDTAVEAMKRGAYDFITKPINIDRLEILIKRALRGREMESENRELKQQADARFGLKEFIGDSAPMQEIYDTLRQVAPSRATVLIQGESGTGKELAARALHQLSPRHAKRFLAVHCAALSPQLLESELFGHEKGAFTGATERRIGRFEQADGGTLFLDEIGEIDMSTQVKILRVLGEERTFERVGGNSAIKTDVRLVAATNRDLEAMVQEGKFRDDLYFRLNVVQITMPPLRTRKDDIPLMVTRFVKSFSKENDKTSKDLTSEAMAALLDYDWPGNVRELRAAVEHGVVMASGPRINILDLPRSLRRPPPATGIAKLDSEPAPVADALNIHVKEAQLIQLALHDTGGNITQAALKLGISRRTMHRKLKALGLNEVKER